MSKYTPIPTSTEQHLRNRRPWRPLTLAILLLTFANGAATAQLETNVGYLDNDASYTGTMEGPIHSFWFHLRYSEMTVRARVRDVDGRGLDMIAILDANSKIQVESRNRIGGELRADHLGKGWYRLYLRSYQENFRYAVTLQVTRRGEPADAGNNFQSAHFLGSVGANGQQYPDRVGLNDAADVFRFQLNYPSNHLELSLLQARRGGAHLELHRPNGGSFQLIQRATVRGDSPLITERLGPGTYFAKVTPELSSSGQQGSSYRIWARNREVPLDNGGDIQNPHRIHRLPINNLGEIVTPQIDTLDAYQFDVPAGPGAGGASNMTVSVSGSRSDFGIFLTDRNGSQIIASNTDRNATVKSFRQALAPSPHKLLVMALGQQPVSYQIRIRVETTPPPPPPNRVGRTSYGGFNFDDHSATTTLTPSAISLPGSFRLDSQTMQFSGPNTAIEVFLEPEDRRSGSFGVTRFAVRDITANGNTLTARVPLVPELRNRRFRVVVITFTNRQPDSYTSPGVLAIR